MNEIKSYIDILKDSSSEVESIIRSVLKLENEKLYNKKPRINNEIVLIIKEVIK